MKVVQLVIHEASEDRKVKSSENNNKIYARKAYLDVSHILNVLQ